MARNDRLRIQGGTALRGTVCISGAKNAALILIAASIMAKGETILDYVPHIEDVYVLLRILEEMGVAVHWNEDNSLSIQAPDGAIDVQAPLELTKKLRASNLLLGSMLGRQQQVSVSFSGGCNIGLRPIDLHLKGFEALGAKLSFLQNSIHAEKEYAHGATVYLDFPSVGATENIMMMACLTPGESVIENAAKEPEIVNLAGFINAMGGSVRGAGTDTIRITGVQELKAVRYATIPDRIEAGTYMLAAAATQGEILIENVISQHLNPVIAKLREMGVTIEEREHGNLWVKADQPLKSVDIKTMPYPGFPTDIQSQMMALLSKTVGTSMIVENVFEKRFCVVNELCRMGANIVTEGHVAIVHGVEMLHGTTVRATDLRAGAALIIAGCAAEGETIIEDAVHIFRGYETVVEKFSSLGATIEVY